MIAQVVCPSREAVEAAGPGSPLEGKAQQALGVALAAAATQPGVLPSGERAAALEAALEALQHALKLDPGDPLTLYHVGLVKVSFPLCCSCRSVGYVAGCYNPFLKLRVGQIAPASTKVELSHLNDYINLLELPSMSPLWLWRNGFC